MVVSELVSKGQSTGRTREIERTHRLHLTVFRAGSPVGTAIPLYGHALN